MVPKSSQAAQDGPASWQPGRVETWVGPRLVALVLGVVLGVPRMHAAPGERGAQHEGKRIAAASARIATLLASCIRELGEGEEGERGECLAYPERMQRRGQGGAARGRASLLQRPSATLFGSLHEERLVGSGGAWHPRRHAAQGAGGRSTRKHRSCAAGIATLGFLHGGSGAGGGGGGALASHGAGGRSTEEEDRCCHAPLAGR